MKKVLIVASYLVFFVLGGLTFTYLTSTEAANGTKKISVVETTVNYFVDNVKKTPPTGQTAFVYQGTTYVPLRFIVNTLGEEFTWDGKTNSAYIGEKPQGTVTYLQDLEAHTATYKMSPKTLVTNMGEKYSHSSYSVVEYKNVVEYLANGKFKKFEAYLAPLEKWKGRAKSNNIGYFKIYADDELVYNSGTIASDITEKIKVSVDLEGASRVKFVSDANPNASLGLLDAKFIH